MASEPKKTETYTDVFPPVYPGSDEAESMSDYLYDIGMTESDYVGFDVGDQ